MLHALKLSAWDNKARPQRSLSFPINFAQTLIIRRPLHQLPLPSIGSVLVTVVKPEDLTYDVMNCYRPWTEYM